MSNAEKQRRYRQRRDAAIDQMPLVKCACGCDTDIRPITKGGKPATYAHGHNPTTGRFKKGQTAWNKGKPAPWAATTHTGKTLSQDELARRKSTRLKNNDGKYQINWTRPKNEEQWIENMSAAQRTRDLSGPNNPFFGKRHTPESRAAISAAKVGAKNANWAGGVATLPYGPEFTRKFKRLIRDRDGHICQSCGVAQDENPTTLEVHHIDHNKKNNRS